MYSVRQFNRCGGVELLLTLRIAALSLRALRHSLGVGNEASFLLRARIKRTGDRYKLYRGLARRRSVFADQMVAAVLFIKIIFFDSFPFGENNRRRPEKLPSQTVR